jgi:uncharacterized membrane protein
MSFGTISKSKRALVAIILCSVSIMAFWPTSLLSYGASESLAVRGYVVNEDGVALSGVTVRISSGGATLATTFTNNYGYFVIGEVESGTYSLSLTKPGYVEVVKSVTLQAETINIGTTYMLRALQLSTSTLRLISDLGNQVTIPFTAQNSGEEPQVVDFLTSSPDGWSTKLMAGSYEVTKINLAPGQSMSFQLEFTVPLTALVDVDYNVSVTAIGITNASLTFTILTKHQIATVSGRIVDEQGNGMQVAVNSYTSDDYLIQSNEASSDGYFAIELPLDTTVSLKFSKDGYVTVTKTVLLESADEQLDLGEIVLAKALSVYTSSLSIVANPRDKLLLPFTVSNIGEDAETVEFLVSDTAEWSTRVLDQNNREVNNVVITSGTASSLKLEVTIPLTATGANNLALTVIGKTIATLDFSINVEQPNESMMFCRFPGKFAIVGDPVVFQVELTNPFSFDAHLMTSIESLPSGWSAAIIVDEEYVTEMVLGTGESVNLVVAVASSTSATTNENYEFLVKVESVDHSITDSLPLTVALTEPEATEEISVSTKFPEVTIEAGEVIQYHITVSNLGDINRLLSLSIVPPADWKAVFKSGDIEISLLAIAAGGSEDLIIEVTPPSTVSLDTYDLPVQIKSESGVVFAEINLKATITGSHKMYLSLSTLLTSTTSGDSASFTATVTNTGFSTLSVVGLEVEAEDGWDVEISPVQVDLLKPQESFSFNVVIDTPKDTLSGDYLVTLTGLSDQAESNEMQVRVTVNTPTEWGIYGFGLALIIIVALVLVFRKFKRR